MTWLTLRGNYIETIPQGPLESALANSGGGGGDPYYGGDGGLGQGGQFSQFHLSRYRRRMDKLDLGENFLTRVPEDAFNGTLAVNDLNIVRLILNSILDLY